MADFESELRQRIEELEKGTHSLDETLGERMSEGEMPNATDITLALSTYGNMIKGKALLEIYNKHFYNEDMIQSEKEVDEALKEVEVEFINLAKEYSR